MSEAGRSTRGDTAQPEGRTSIAIAFLADYPELIPTLARWFQSQWPAYYGGRTPADIAQDFHAEAKREGLPVRLVALARAELAGTIALRGRAMNAFPEYRPALGGLVVADSHRGLGIGTALVRAGMALARQQGYETVYTATAAARGIVERLGWEPVRAVVAGEERVVIYHYELGGRGPTATAAG